MRRIRPVMTSAAIAALCAVMLLSGCASEGRVAGVDTAAPSTRASAPAASPTPSWTPGEACSGVEVKVQFGLLGGSDIDACAPVSAPTTVAKLFGTLGITTEGTTQYGDQVVCRVNGLPSANAPFTVPGHKPYTEKCASMPAAFAYWALWLKPSSSGKWGYAEKGVTAQQVSAGQIVGLKFTTGTDATPPQG